MSLSSGMIALSTIVDDWDDPARFWLGVQATAIEVIDNGPWLDCSSLVWCRFEEHLGLSLVTLLIALKSRSREAPIGLVLELLTHKVGAVAVNKECPAKESSW